MMWILFLTLAVVIIEAGIIYSYLWTKDNAPEYSLWVIMGSKVIKILFAIVAIVAVHLLSEQISLKEFSIAVMIGYLTGMIVEVIFFLKKKN